MTAVTSSSSSNVVVDVGQNTESTSKSVEEQVEVEPDEHPLAGQEERQTAEGLVSGRHTGTRNIRLHICVKNNRGVTVISTHRHSKLISAGK